LLTLLRPLTGRGVLATVIAAEVLLEKLLMGKLVAEVRLVERSVVVSGDCCAAILVTDVGWVTILRSALVGVALTRLEPPKLEDPGRTVAAEMPELCTVVDDEGCTDWDVDMLVASPLCNTWISLKDVSGNPWLLVGSSTCGA